MEESTDWYDEVTKELDDLVHKGQVYAQNPVNFIHADCWCGSNKKYKDCHYKQIDMAPMTKEDCRLIFKKYRRKSYSCLFNGCSEKSIKSHSIPSSWLSSIIDSDNFVYNFPLNLFNSSPEEPFEVEKLGVFESSTFKGFCLEHDSKLFEKIEKEGGWELTDENCLLLYYRSVCYELFAKCRAMSILEEVRGDISMGKDPVSQVCIFEVLCGRILGMKKAVEDLSVLKDKIEQYIKEKDFSVVSYTYIPIESPINIMASGIHHPEQTFEGRDLQNLAEDNLMNMSCIVGQNGEEEFVLFISIDENDERAARFHKDLLTCDNLGNRIVIYLLETTENLFWRISDWDHLTNTQKDKVYSILGGSVNSDILEYSKEDFITGIESFATKDSKIQQKIV
ncbi:TPA: SEC-C domain-containing protein [Candidatus Dojkabacteria bacterium]|uniref:SEC-C domain-containing protein n=1 Tax=Candidatus Dojkabacteria bacterium TaxID=2099670 RepID=A0A832QDH9_9BACT|nr:SEC-C domain-containing protein [Candidatus Dojkabacteria bacterium]